MIRALRYLPMLSLVACAPDTVSLRGTLADSALATDTALTLRVGDGAGTPLRAGQFALDVTDTLPLELQLRRADKQIGRLTLAPLAAGARAELLALRTDDESELMFPAAVRLDGADMMIVNGIRMAPVATLPQQFDEAGVVLARDGSGAAFLIRPGSDALPDLRVVLTPETEVTTPDGDPAPIAEVAAGDSVRIVGAADHQYIVAQRLIVPRSRALTGSVEMGDQSGEARARQGSDGDRSPARVRESAPAARPRVTRVAPSTRAPRGGGQGKGRAKVKSHGRGKKH